jgi:hypothetical protein
MRPFIDAMERRDKVVVRVFPIRHDLPWTFKCVVTTTPLVENNTIKYISLDIKDLIQMGPKPFQEFRWQVVNKSL